MNVDLRILRYDPEPTSLAFTAGEPAVGVAAAPAAEANPPSQAKPHWVTYKVEVDPMELPLAGYLVTVESNPLVYVLTVRNM